MSFGGNDGRGGARGGGGSRDTESPRKHIARLVQQARDDRASARGLSVTPRPPPRGRSHGYGPSPREVRASQAIFKKTGSSFEAAVPLYGGRRPSPPRRPPHQLDPLPPSPSPRSPSPPPRPPTPEPFSPSPSPEPSRPGSAMSTASTTSAGSAASLSDIDIGLPSTPSPPPSPSPRPPPTPPPSPPPSPTPSMDSDILLAEAEHHDEPGRTWSPIPATREEAQRAIDLKNRGRFMRKLRPGSAGTQKRAAKLEAIEEADRRLIRGMGEHDDKAKRAETVAKVGGKVGGAASAILGVTPAAAASPFVAAGTAALTTGARTKAAYDARQSQKAIDNVRQYIVGDTHLDARSAARGAQMRENAGKAVTGALSAVTDAFAPGAASELVSAGSKAAGKALGKSTKDARVDEAQAVLATSGYHRPRTPPPDGEFDSIALPPAATTTTSSPSSGGSTPRPPTQPQGSNPSPRTRR